MPKKVTKLPDDILQRYMDRWDHYTDEDGIGYVQLYFKGCDNPVDFEEYQFPDDDAAEEEAYRLNEIWNVTFDDPVSTE